MLAQEEELPNGEDEEEEASGPEMFASAREAVQHSDLPTDLSDTSGDAGADSGGPPADCPSQHEGRETLTLVLPLSVDQLFTLLFTGSRFFHDLLTSRKTYDVTESNWQPCPETGHKLRQLTYTVTLNHAMAKTAQTTETQVTGGGAVSLSVWGVPSVGTCCFSCVWTNPSRHLSF